MPRVGSEGVRVESGLGQDFLRNLTGRVGSGRVGSGRVESRSFQIPRVGRGHPDPIRPARSDSTRENLCLFSCFFRCYGKCCGHRTGLLCCANNVYPAECILSSVGVQTQKLTKKKETDDYGIGHMNKAIRAARWCSRCVRTATQEAVREARVRRDDARVASKRFLGARLDRVRWLFFVCTLESRYSASQKDTFLRGS